MTNASQSKLKIGILIPEFDALHNFEIEIIKTLLDDKEVELALLIRDGRKLVQQNESSFWNKIFSKNFLGRLFFKLQCAIEKRLFPAPIHNRKAEVVQGLQGIPELYLTPIRKGFLDVFSPADSKQVAAYELDVLLRYEFDIIRGDILNSAKQGIWSFHHADNAVNRGGPACFWEIVNKEPYIGVTLQKLTPVLDGGMVIEKAFFNYSHSFVASRQIVFDGSVSLLIKNINKLKHGAVVYEVSPPYPKPLYKQPNLNFVLKYMMGFYFTSIVGRLRRSFIRLLGLRSNCWTLFLSPGEILTSQLNNRMAITLPKNHFWADPFLVTHKGQLFAFFEDFSYKTNKGIISCGKVINGRLLDIVEVLDLPYHLSYPQILIQGENIFMIPETAANKRVEVYKCVSFPTKWVLYASAFEGEQIVDTTFYEDVNNDCWLFLNKGLTNKEELHIFKVDSLRLQQIIPHKNNPVKIDTLSARNAGSIFKYEDHYYRPSQVNSHGNYGNGLNLNKIIQLDLNTYIEEKIVTIQPNFEKGLNGIHHVHQIDDYFIFDARYKVR